MFYRPLCGVGGQCQGLAGDRCDSWNRSRLLSHDSSNRKRGVFKRAPIDNGWYGKKASRVSLTTWKGAHPAARVFLVALIGVANFGLWSQH